MTDDLRRQLADYQSLQDYYEFLDSYFLQMGDEPGALSHDEMDQLGVFYTMYSSLSDDSDGFEDILDSLCNKDDEYKRVYGGFAPTRTARRNHEADSHEHWLPRGLGTFRGNTTLVNQVCGDCNNSLGRLDEELVKTEHTGIDRALLGVRGRHRAPSVSPFQYRAMQAEQPTTMMMPAIGRDHQIQGEAYRDEEGRPSARPIRQVVLRMPDGSMQPVPFLAAGPPTS